MAITRRIKGKLIDTLAALNPKTVNWLYERMRRDERELVVCNCGSIAHRDDVSECDCGKVCVLQGCCSCEISAKDEEEWARTALIITASV